MLVRCLTYVRTVAISTPIRVLTLLSVAALAATAQNGGLQFNINPNVIIAVGVPATIRWTLSGGTPPYQTVLVNAEALPLGLSFNADDFEIMGTPTIKGTYPVSLVGTDSAGNSASITLNITVGPTIAFGTPTLPPAVQGQPYAFQLVAMGGGPPYTFSLGGGTLPPGFRIDSRGIIGGVPSGTGTFSLLLKVTDAQGSVATMNYNVQVTAPIPVITVSAVVNAASGKPTLAPGAYGSIFGTNLASTTANNAGFPLRQTLADVTVTMSGVPVPLLSVSPTQINFQVPFLLGTANTTLMVSSAGGTSQATQITLLPAAPGTFQTVDGRALALNEDGSLNGPTKPDRSGSILVLYLTGAGGFDPSLITGGTAPPNTLVPLTPLPAVTIAGRAADIVFAGAAPGQASGLLQINVRVPSGLPSGDYPLIVTINGQSSQPVLISVAAQP